MRAGHIEDDRDAAAYHVKAFREVGHVADHASDGVTGYDLAREGGYDVAVVDRMLPKMDGLSLIGAVVAEIAAGAAGAGSGLAYRIAESGYRLNIPRMFAALLLLSLAGIVIYALLALISHLALRRWHESALGKES